jgi:hypothetical protein
MGMQVLEEPFDVGAEQRESATLMLVADAMGAPPVIEDRRVVGGCASAPGGVLLVAVVSVLRRRRVR